jgi:hypothetical protein
MMEATFSNWKEEPTKISESSFLEEAIHDLKSSLSEALVHYYVLVGEMVND